MLSNIIYVTHSINGLLLKVCCHGAVKEFPIETEHFKQEIVSLVDKNRDQTMEKEKVNG